MVGKTKQSRFRLHSAAVRLTGQAQVESEPPRGPALSWPPLPVDVRKQLEEDTDHLSTSLFAGTKIDPKLLVGKLDNEDCKTVVFSKKGTKGRRKPTKTQEVTAEIRGLLHEIDEEDQERDRLRQEIVEVLMRAHRQAESQEREADRQVRQANAEGFARLITEIRHEIQAQTGVMRDLVSSLGVLARVQPSSSALQPWPSTLQPPSSSLQPHSSSSLQPPSSSLQPHSSSSLHHQPSSFHSPPSYRLLQPSPFQPPPSSHYHLPVPIDHPIYIPTPTTPSAPGHSLPGSGEVSERDDSFNPPFTSSYMHLLAEEED